MPTMSLPPTSEPTSVTSAYAVPPMNATSIAPPMPTIDFGRPLANVVMSPVFGSTREIRPAAPSVTYSAPPGPMVLPVAPSRPVTSRAAWDIEVIQRGNLIDFSAHIAGIAKCAAETLQNFKPTIRVFSRQRSYAVHQGSVKITGFLIDNPQTTLLSCKEPLA